MSNMLNVNNIDLSNNLGVGVNNFYKSTDVCALFLFVTKKCFYPIWLTYFCAIKRCFWCRESLYFSNNL